MSGSSRSPRDFDLPRGVYTGVDIEFESHGDRRGRSGIATSIERYISSRLPLEISRYGVRVVGKERDMKTGMDLYEIRCVVSVDAAAMRDWEEREWRPIKVSKIDKTSAISGIDFAADYEKGLEDVVERSERQVFAPSPKSKTELAKELDDEEEIFGNKDK